MGQEAHAGFSCNVSAAALNFGTIDIIAAQSGVYPTMTAPISVSCTGVTSGTATVCLFYKNNNQSGGTYYNTLTGASSGQSAGFQVFGDAAYQTLWGNKNIPSPIKILVDLATNKTTPSPTVYGKMIGIPTPFSQLAFDSYTNSVNNSVTSFDYSLGDLDCNGAWANQNKSGFTFTVTATVAAQCAISTAANDLNFGSVSAGMGTVTGSTAFGVTCTNGTPYYIGLLPSNGNTAGAGVMTSVANAATNTDQVPYQLRSTSGTSGTIWGNTATSTSVGNGVAGTGTGSAASYNIYGTATVANYTPDSYQDQVVINVNY
ncbi:Csu type fimbrial protein [Brachymonas sp. M4Q-1]|uniref:Csu type fimbrial protein n=1 Tax=Brachymonas sp. M4Q-1 TaxID=3416906 RepID=UPI003CF6CB39